jgi:outer membrane protein assembly factor BamB
MKRSLTTLGQVAFSSCFLLTANALAQLSPEWITNIPTGNIFESGLQAMIVDEGGVSYVTGVTGTALNTDTVTAAINPDGTIRWKHTFNGAANWLDRAFAISFAPGGVLYVVGSTPDANRTANLLVLKYDQATGTLLNSIQYSSGSFTSEAGVKVTTDAAGNVYVGALTVGDGRDAMILTFDAAGVLQWTNTWDGGAFGPLSQDYVRGMVSDPSGNPVLMIQGITSANQPNYVLIKYDATDGSEIWNTSWGTNGGDYPVDIEIDAAGDIYVTGTSIINGVDRFGTIKLNGTNGQVVWESHNGIDFNNLAYALAVDDQGGVYVLGQTDPHGDRSKLMHDMYAVKLDAATGAELWAFAFGSKCRGCTEIPGDIMVDSGGNVLLVGISSSPPYVRDMLMFVLDSATGIEKDRAVIDEQPGGDPTGWILRRDAAENIYIGGAHTDLTIPVRGIAVTKFASLVDGCYADCDQSTGAGVLDVFDFLCFQNSFVAGEPYACDCDTSTGNRVCDVFDFLCFQDAFVAGCP